MPQGGHAGCPGFPQRGGVGVGVRVGVGPRVGVGVRDGDGPQSLSLLQAREPGPGTSVQFGLPFILSQIVCDCCGGDVGCGASPVTS